jgi:DNA adenine methylase
VWRYSSPLRYPGGKGKIANYVKLVMLENDLVGREYVEPYAGGASVALSLLFEDYVPHIHINDLNSGVHAFWQAALLRTEELCERVRTTPATIATWRVQRAVLSAATEHTDAVDLGFATFFLNRTNRSGIIAGGVIGGLDQSGPWKIDARYNADELAKRIGKIGRYRSRISLTRLDAVDFLQRWTSNAEEPAFVYLDPPYFVKGRGLYDNFYSPDDHEAVAAAVQRLAHPWIVSYDAAPQILDLYGSTPSLRYSLAYSASSQPSSGPEVMFFRPGLQIPAGGIQPAGIAPATVLDRRRQLALR